MKTKSKKKIRRSDEEGIARDIEKVILFGTAAQQEGTGRFVGTLPPIAFFHHAIFPGRKLPFNLQLNWQEVLPSFLPNHWSSCFWVPREGIYVVSKLPKICSNSWKLGDSLITPEVAIDKYEITDWEKGTYRASRNYEAYKEGIWQPAPFGIRNDVHYTSAQVRFVTRGRPGKLKTQNRSVVPSSMTIAAAKFYFAAKNSWCVKLSAFNSVSVLLPADPVGILALFSSRDSPKHPSGRRKALVHWVNEHFRKSRVDPEAEIKIREYLRGCREFDWFGLNCSVQIPES